MKRFFTFLFILIIGFVVLFLVKYEQAEEKQIIQNSTVVTGIKENKEKEATEIYAVWLTYSEIGALVKGKSENEYRESLEEVLKNLRENKINTVFYQCRAFCDSLYASDIFPASKYITTNSVAPIYDPFEIFIQKANEQGVAVHCWINPYRISYNNGIENLPENSPARELYKAEKQALIICEEGIFLNPAHSEGRRLVLAGIKEILEKYQVAGIHFDDYFYPESNSINDKKLYEQYKASGGLLSLSDWRRENVNALISSVYSLVKAKSIHMIFSISPSADIEKCKNDFYCDVEKWCNEDGFVDVLIPQIYYGFENETMPFKRVVENWEKLSENGNVRLVCGLAVYKCGKKDSFAGRGQSEWAENVNILSQQYEQLEKSFVWQGFSLFSYSYCFGENVTHFSKKEIKKLLYMVE